MMADGRWDSATNVKFIEAYKQQVSLWDPKHPEYKNREQRYVAYRNIIKAMAMDLTVKFVISKIRSLRNTYNNEILKSKKSLMNGKNRIYKSKIPWLDSLDFLKNIDNCTSNSDNILVKQEPIQATTSLSNVEVDNDSYSQNADHLNQRASKRLRTGPLIETRKAQEKVSTQQLNDTENDEFDSFGNVVAKQLRTLPLEVALESEELILAVLRRQRMKVLKLYENE